MEAAAKPEVAAPPLAGYSEAIAFVVMTLAFIIAPAFAYPVFLMKVLCFALFACAFNLLIGYVGLLSFGHALFFGWASYVSAHAAKVWGLTPELAILAGREVTVQLRHPLAAGHYVFFADPLAVGVSIAVKERAHLDAREHEEAVAALERGYAARMAPRLETAFLVALGSEGEVHALVPPTERRGRPPWAMARFEIERVLKGRKPRKVTLVGPLHASKLLPRAPALRAGRHSILILRKPPENALARLPEDERQGAAFIADTHDIQPPDRLAALERIIRGSDRE